MPDPWSYADKTGKEHAHQAALFMWANMTMMFGPVIADRLESYTVAGWAKGHFDNIVAGKYGEPHEAVPVPQLKWLHAIHNQGHGDAVRGGMAKAEGVKAGVYDMFLPVPRYIGLVASRLIGDKQGWPSNNPASEQAYCGFYLELKVGKGRTSDKQNEFATDMQAAGYATDVAWGWLEARNKLLAYLGLPQYI